MYTLVRRARLLSTTTTTFPRTLQLQQQRQPQHPQQPLTFCVGNEAGDLDSIVSSIATAYLHTAAHATRTVPLLPFNRAEFRLRRDAVFLFNLVGFDLDTQSAPKEVIFLDELDGFLARELESTLPIALILTDHNKRTLDHPALQHARVQEIVDHHTDSGDHSDIQGPLRNIVSGLGSACTLVAESCMEAEDQGLCTLSTELITLLMATIILDAREWSPVKSTPRDRAAYDNLSQRYQRQTSIAPLEQLYARTKRARHDVSSLSLVDLLHLDYKECSSTGGGSGVSCGIPSIMRSYTDMCATHDNAHIDTILMEFGKVKKVDIVFGFTAKENKETGGQERRVKHVIVCDTSGRSDRVHSFVQFLEHVPQSLSKELRNDPILTQQRVIENGVLETNLEPMESSTERMGTRTVVIEIQELISRKALKPIIEEWMESVTA